MAPPPVSAATRAGPSDYLLPSMQRLIADWTRTLETAKGKSLAGWTGLGSATARASLSPDMINRMTGHATGRVASWATATRDCGNWVKVNGFQILFSDRDFRMRILQYNILS